MAMIEGYNMPGELYYHQEDTWVKIEDDGNVRVGMTDFYQKLSGDATYVDLPFEGDIVSQGETCGKIQSAKWVGKVVAPISGEIVEVNQDLEDNPTLINEDPYGKAWIMLIKPSALKEELTTLVHGDSVDPWLKEKIAEVDAKKEQA